MNDMRGARGWSRWVRLWVRILVFSISIINVIDIVSVNGSVVRGFVGRIGNIPLSLPIHNTTALPLLPLPLLLLLQLLLLSPEDILLVSPDMSQPLSSPILMLTPEPDSDLLLVHQ